MIIKHSLAVAVHVWRAKRKTPNEFYLTPKAVVTHMIALEFFWNTWDRQ